MTTAERDQGVTTYRYAVVVEHDESAGRAVAYVNDAAGPLRGEGDTPVLALSVLAATLARWPIGGREEWTSTLQGRAFLAECHLELGMGPPPGKA